MKCISPTKLLLIITLCIFCGCNAESPRKNIAELQDFEKDWIVINYWASWCIPCVKEIPELNKLQQLSRDIDVVGINYDGILGEELDKEASRLGIKFPNLLIDPSANLGASRPIVLPTTMIVDKKRELRTTLIGPQTYHSINTAITAASKD